MTHPQRHQRPDPGSHGLEPWARRRRPAPRATLAPFALALAFLATSAAAQPRVDATAISTQTGTLLTFLESTATHTSAMACYRRGQTPDRSYNCLLQVVRTAGMEETLAGPGPVTVFAPTDSAFAELASLVGDRAFSAFVSDPVRLRTTLEASMAPRRLTAADLVRRAGGATRRGSVATVGGTDLPIAVGRFEQPTSTTIAVGSAPRPTWQAYVSGRSVVLNNGALVPLSMVVLPPGVLGD